MTVERSVTRWLLTMILLVLVLSPGSLGQQVALAAADPLQLVDPFSLRSTSGAWPPALGDQLIAHISVSNTTGAPLHVEYIGVRGRKDGTAYWDIGFWTIDIGAGQEWTLDPNNERPLEVGDYSFRVSYSLDGVTWKEIGTEINFTVLPQIGGIPGNQYAALEALYNATDGPNWTHKWVLPTDNACSLWGVTCSNGRVTSLDLSDNNLRGTLPAEIGNLGRLNGLWLPNNELSGPIPPEIGNLSVMSLNLSGNNLSGAIPAELGNVEDLVALMLGDNALSGPIPMIEVQEQLADLQYVYLSGNQLSGDLPCFPMSDDLGSLLLSHNNFTGQVPECLGYQSELDRLDISWNGLSGSLPNNLMNLNLTELRYDNTYLCEPTDAAFQTWLTAIETRSGTGAACAADGSKPWLLMYYLDGDNDLNKSQEWLVSVLKNVSVNSNMDIAIVYDGQAIGDSRYYWIGDAKSYISKGELDMSSPATLTEFVEWARAVSPHEHEMLMLSDHGSLTRLLQDCAGHDCVPGSSIMPLTSLSSAMAQITASGGPIDVLYMETCLSGSIEGAYQMQGYADFYVATESLVILPTRPYYLKHIETSTTPEQLARLMAANYAQELSNYRNFPDKRARPYTISVARLSQLPNLTSKVSAFSALLRSRMSTVGDSLLRTQVLNAVQPL